MASGLRSTMAASGSWFGPRLCRKGRCAALRRGTKPISPGARRLLGWGWVLTANGVPHRPRDSVAWSGGIELGAVVPLRGTSDGLSAAFQGLRYVAGGQGSRLWADAQSRELKAKAPLRPEVSAKGAVFYRCLDCQVASKS